MSIESIFVNRIGHPLTRPVTVTIISVNFSERLEHATTRSCNPNVFIFLTIQSTLYTIAMDNTHAAEEATMRPIMRTSQLEEGRTMQRLKT